jgi:hypothetical protein
LIDVTTPAALLAFQHPPYVLVNPTHTDYEPTQNLMDAVYHHPGIAAGAKVQGIQAPSVRTPRSGSLQPRQQVFVLLPKQTRLPGALVCSWELSIEFLEVASRHPVTGHTTEVDWRRPRFWLDPRGASAAGGIPAFASRSPYAAGVWHDGVIEINYG